MSNPGYGQNPSLRGPHAAKPLTPAVWHRAPARLPPGSCNDLAVAGRSVWELQRKVQSTDGDRWGIATLLKICALALREQAVG